jgi:hypothetical protein
LSTPKTGGDPRFIAGRWRKRQRRMECKNTLSGMPVLLIIGDSKYLTVDRTKPTSLGSAKIDFPIIHHDFQMNISDEWMAMVVPEYPRRRESRVIHRLRRVSHILCNQMIKVGIRLYFKETICNLIQCEREIRRSHESQLEVPWKSIPATHRWNRRHCSGG